jgi:hypothetical protein
MTIKKVTVSHVKWELVRPASVAMSPWDRIKRWTCASGFFAKPDPASILAQFVKAPFEIQTALMACP